ncbi:hypothetical protein CX683_10625 [Salmonella enterica subsp. enterica serovar Sundsvall]|nr:hypothetical protein [Salmonella enterica subsp. enterica serovar Sundsvall]
MNGTRAVKHADSRGCSGRERNACTYTVLSLTHRRGFQADWLFFNKMCYFIFCNTSGEKQIFPL